MTLHEEWIKAEQDAALLHQSSSLSGPNVMVKMTREGIHIETRSPSGTNDIVRDLYLTKEQALVIYNAYERFFGSLNR